jgi:hypothetical protein
MVLESGVQELSDWMARDVCHYALSGGALHSMAHQRLVTWVTSWFLGSPWVPYDAVHSFA